MLQQTYEKQIGTGFSEDMKQAVIRSPMLSRHKFPASRREFLERQERSEADPLSQLCMCTCCFLFVPNMFSKMDTL